MMKQITHDERGASAAEFALVLPVLLLLLFGIIDVGRYMWAFNQAEKATQVGVRMAVVTDVVASDLATQNYVGSNALLQGDTIPASALGVLTCTSATACACPTAPCPGTTRNATSFTAIVDRMKEIDPTIAAANVEVSYRGSGLGYAGDPDGMQISPLVTVRLTGMSFTPLFLLMQANTGMPDFAATLTAEDSSGSQSN